MTTSTQATELQAAIKKTLHSASFGRFMAQAIQTTLGEAHEAAAKDDIALLKPPTVSKTLFCDSGPAVSYTTYDSTYGMVHRLQKEHQPNNPKYLGLWYGNERRTDNLGREWSRSIKMVQDDFGNLVEVAA